MGFYDDDGSGLLSPPLHVLRFDPRQSKMTESDLQSVETNRLNIAMGKGDVLPVFLSLSSVCLGSVLRITEVEGNVVLDTHINPSAGCLLVLDRDLRFKKGLWGFSVGHIKGQLIVEGDTIHFAPVHAASLYALDVVSGKVEKLYPAAADRARSEFSAQLRKVMPTSETCRRENLPCDPNSFSVDFENFRFGREDFDFTAVMHPEGFGQGAENAVVVKSVRYRGLLHNGRWTVHPEP